MKILLGVTGCCGALNIDNIVNKLGSRGEVSVVPTGRSFAFHSDKGQWPVYYESEAWEWVNQYGSNLTTPVSISDKWGIDDSLLHVELSKEFDVLVMRSERQKMNKRQTEKRNKRISQAAASRANGKKGGRPRKDAAKEKEDGNK